MALHDCRLFLNEDNKLGLAPFEAAVGDVVCMIRGAVEPCILRERPQGDWSLVSGECYILGIYPGNSEPDKLETYISSLEGILTFGGEENFTIW
jgi:hypothetical protein